MIAFYQLIAFAFVLVTCGAQEQLTCYRTGDLSSTTRQTTTEYFQNRPTETPELISAPSSKVESGNFNGFLVSSLRGKAL